jgi:hypothetical protein
MSQQQDQDQEQEQEQHQKFFKGSRFRHVKEGHRSNKLGTVNFVWDDRYEKDLRKIKPSHYYYFVIFDDNTHEYYLSQVLMRKTKY